MIYYVPGTAEHELEHFTYHEQIYSNTHIIDKTKLCYLFCKAVDSSGCLREAKDKGAKHSAGTLLTRNLQMLWHLPNELNFQYNYLLPNTNKTL